MQYTDNRSKRVVFTSSCILNQNVRGFGTAVFRGTVAPLVGLLLANDVGIEQLPCPEREFWGGIGRTQMYLGQSLAFKAADKGLLSLAEFVVNRKRARTRSQCRRLARKIVDCMDDHVANGFEVVGVIGVDDSPTCGVDHEVDLLDVVRRREQLCITLDDLESPRIDTIGRIAKALRKPGKTYWLGELIAEARRRGHALPAAGFDPWADDPRAEARRVADALGLEVPDHGS